VKQVRGRLVQVVGSGTCCHWACLGTIITIMLPTLREHLALLHSVQWKAAEGCAVVVVVVVVEVDGECCTVQEAATQYTEALATLT
jgi:hypothetical protein